MPNPDITSPLNPDLHAELSEIISTLTTSGSKTLDEKLLKKIKQICRMSDAYVDYVYHLLMTQLRKEHSEIRFSALLISNELFCRSHKFRTLLLMDFQEFLQLCAETDPDEPLPLPVPAAKLLKQKTLDCINNWYHKFKDGYKMLVIAHNFLKECKQVNFEDLEARSIVERAQEAETRQRLENILNEKVRKATEQLTELSSEIKAVLEQLTNCLRLLQPHSEVYFEESDFKKSEGLNSSSNLRKNSGKDFVTRQNSQELLRHHGMTNRNITIQVTLANDTSSAVYENDDNSAILENMRDLRSQITSHFLPSIAKVLQKIIIGETVLIMASSMQGCRLKSSSWT